MLLPFHGSSSYLDALLTAAEKSRICQLQRLLGLRTLLPVILQPAELSFIYGESLKCLLWAKIALKAVRVQTVAVPGLGAGEGSGSGRAKGPTETPG